MAPALIVHPTRVATSSADEDGCLVHADGRLVAVLVRLADPMHGGLAGSWFLEAGFGPCGARHAPVFDSLDAAREWVGQQVGGA